VTYVRIYLVGSFLLAVAMIRDVWSLIGTVGGPANEVFSVFEFLWLAASVAALVVQVRNDLPILLPVSYCVYSLVSWLHALYLLLVLHAHPRAYKLPASVGAVFLLFGAFFAVASLLALRALPRRRVV
jgi:hypothetical protein